MRVLRNTLCALLLACGPTYAGLTNTLWYPPTNAAVRWTDGTNWVFAKDVWRVQLGGAALERLAVVGQYNSKLEFPPVRGPWENEFCHTAKTSLFGIVGNYLDLRYTNSVGVFTNFYNISDASYSNRYWTVPNLLAFCNLPPNFFDYTPARFLGPNGLTNGNTNIVSGYSTAHYGWEGVYRVVTALDYYQPQAGWVEVGVDESLDESGYELVTLATNFCDIANTYEIPEAWRDWTPTNIMTNAVITATGSGGEITLWQIANGVAVEEAGTDAARYWIAGYDYDVPYDSYPAGWMRYYGDAFHPTNTLDAQSFTRAENVYTDINTSYWVAVHYTNPSNYFSIASQAVTGTYALADRGAWSIELYGTNWMARSGTSLITGSPDQVLVAPMYLNPTNAIGAEYGFTPWGTIDPASAWGHSGIVLEDTIPSISLPFIQQADVCAPSAQLYDSWLNAYRQYGLINNVALRPAWVWRGQ